MEEMAPYASVDNLEKLRVYQLARSASRLVWIIVLPWNFQTKKVIGDQWVRATDSMSANIAEGYGRYFFNESIKFYYYARGSLFESCDWFSKAHERKLIIPAHAEELQQHMNELPKEINLLIKRTRINSQQFNNKSINNKPINHSTNKLINQ